MILLFLFFYFKSTLCYVFNGKFYQENTTTLFSSRSYITIPFCIGTTTNKQCFDMLYDIEARYILIMSNSVSPKGFNSSISETYERNQYAGHVNIIPPKIRITSYLASDRLYHENHYKTDVLSFLEAYKIDAKVDDLKYQGYIGFSINNVFGNNFLILHYLERNKLASNKNFYHKFINRTDVTIYVGDIGIHNNVKELSDLKYCNLSSQPKEATLWYCPFDYVSTGDKIITQLDSTNNKINFHTTWKDMLIPSSVGNSLFFLYINSSKGKCHIINDNRIGIDNQGDYIQCDKGFNINTLPTIDIGISSNGLKIHLQPQDIFDNSLTSIIRTQKYISIWQLNMEVVKHYDMYFDYNNRRIGFKENHIFDIVFPSINRQPVRKYLLFFNIMILTSSLIILIGIIIKQQ